MLKEKLKIEIIWFTFLPPKLSIRAKTLVPELRREESSRKKKQKEISQLSSIGEILIFHRTSSAEASQSTEVEIM